MLYGSIRLDSISKNINFPRLKSRCKCKFCKVCHYCCCVASAAAVIDAVLDISMIDYVVAVAVAVVAVGSDFGGFALFH